nr:GspH/FimT family pseudopilin [Chromobacterium paludis]
MMVIAILAITVAFAVPAYQNTIAMESIQAESSNLYTDILYARSEAIKQGRFVLVCQSSNGAACDAAGSGADWKVGWIVTSGNSCANGTGGTVLRKQASFSSTDTAAYTNLAATPAAGTTPFCFNRMGYAPSANTGKVVVRSVSNASATPYCVVVEAYGHPAILRGGQTSQAGTACP